MEHYVTNAYDLKPLGCGIDCLLVVRQTRQYTRRIKTERFACVRDIKEVLIVPPLVPFMNASTVDAALDAVWTEAFKISKALQCKTKE